MVDIAMKSQPAEVVKRVTPIQTSAFAIDLADKTVDCVFSMRLMHHIGQADHRLKMLSEFYRVSRDTVILSLWVDGNYKAWKRKKLERRRTTGQKSADSYQNRFVIPREQIEAEFKQAGFSIVSSIDFLPIYAMWRVYLLRKV
jgi:ubiquinone/menaquinone biosynthesis C-methylase UbiE